MTDKIPGAGKLDPNVVQRQASDPSSSVWVTASAGTGKTKVLTDRVLRLMLHGAKPDQILCLTFTRAAASVMTNRIREELGVWATCDDAKLAQKLEHLEGKKPDAETTRRARQLFAEFLDAHGGLRVQTIHSFSQGLLRRFPIESGVPPYFDVMDDQTADELLRESRAEILRQVHEEPHTALARAVHMVTPEIPEDDFIALISELTYRRGQLLSIFAQHGDMEKTISAVYRYLGTPQGGDPHVMQADLNSDRGLNGVVPDIDGLTQAADTLAGGSPADLEKAKMIKAWLLHPEQRVELFNDYAAVFLTTEGTMRKKMTTKGAVAAQDAMEAEARRLMRGIEEISTANVARGTDSILRLTGAILRKYEQKKKSLNLLDYDDLVYRAGALMREDNDAAWVLQKLPGNLQHVLIDEAQDTNPDQWQLAASIVKEFFHGRGRDPKVGTLFVVGDEKQSIFSFQRADPKEFGQRKKFFAGLVEGAGGSWREVEMDIAFRSSPAITQAVDAVFANPAASDGLFFKGDSVEKTVHHNPFRRGQAGVVEVRPVLRAEKKEERAPWTLPLQREEASDPAAELAGQIADQIKEWLDKGEQLPARDRPVNPADILILVRRRTEFVDEMVRALKKRDIPVAGADRMSLREQIVIMDMVALGEFLLFPRDDAKLAAVLKSPLTGLNDQDIEDLALGRKGDLWDALQQKARDPSAKEIYKKAFDYLSGLQAQLNTERPYEFYSSVLMNACPRHEKSGLAALYGRLGFEAEDPLVEFMNALERFERRHVPSLQGFLSWLEAGEAEVKREISLNPEAPRVHIMTVHGAKGLEAPIVILPDTTGIPENNPRARPRFLWPDNDRDVPLWVPRSDLENSVFVRERQQAELERDQEYRRLLYVAMTRAADRLYVYGYQNADKTSPKSWYSLIRKGIAENLGGQVEKILPPASDNGDALKEKPLARIFDAAAQPVPPEDDPETTLRFSVPQTEKPRSDGMKPLSRKKTATVPAWARTLPKADQSPVKKFRPSQYKGVNDNERAAPSPLLEGDSKVYQYRKQQQQLGTVIHQLFDFLPVLAAEEREEAARKYLAKPAWGIPEKDQEAALKDVLAVMNDPEFGHLFGPASRGEVNITGSFDKDGQRHVMAGQIDRLVVDDKTVTIIDFKNTRKVPKDATEVGDEYLIQMAAYRQALQQIYPGKQVKCALLYTREAKLIPLSSDSLDAALKKIDLKPHAPSKKPAP